MTPSHVKLFRGLAERIPQFSKHSFDPTPPAPFQHGDVWVLAALLQKAIRRGDLLMARRAGHQLLAMDPTRLWRRLLVTGMEDIGIGDADAAVAMVGLASLPGLRRLIGSNGVALDIALRLGCDAVKDRTGDGFCSIAREMVGTAHSLNEASDNAWRAALASTYLEWRRRLRAGFLLSEIGKRSEERLSAFVPVSEIFRAFGVPDNFMDACEVYRFKASDPLAVFVPLGFSLWLQEGTERATVSHQLPPVEVIGGLPDYALDPLHTRIGRRAVDLWLRSYLERPPFSAEQVAAGLWIFESGACDKTLNWRLGQEIEDQAVEADMGRKGLAGFGALKSFIEQERSVLCCARKAALECAVRRAQQTGEHPLAAAAE